MDRQIKRGLDRQTNRQPWSGEQVRITAQLIDSNTGYHLWSGTYNRELKDIFAVQDEIAREIVAALQVELGTGEEPVIPARAAPPTNDMEAYQIYLQARHQWKRRGKEAIARSISLLKDATTRDPQFARAWAGLAAAYVVYPGYAQEQDREPWNERALEAAQRALSVDPNIGEAHAVLAEIDNMNRRWTDAEAGFFFATNLDPAAFRGPPVRVPGTGRGSAAPGSDLSGPELQSCRNLPVPGLRRPVRALSAVSPRPGL